MGKRIVHCMRHRLVCDMLRVYGKKCEKVAESYVEASPHVSKCFVEVVTGYCYCSRGYIVEYIEHMTLCALGIRKYD